MQFALTKSAPNKDELIEKLETPTNIAYLNSLSEEKLIRIKGRLAATRHGMHTTAPITCLGPEKCPFLEHCPIPPRDSFDRLVKLKNGGNDLGDMNDYPLGQPCVMESLYAQQKVIDYVQHLGTNPANPVEMSIISELALIDLYKQRATIFLSKGDKTGQGIDFLLRDISVDPETGAENVTTKVHPIISMMDTLEKRRDKWLEKLMETRKSKWTMATKIGAVSEDSKVLGELKRLRELMNISRENAEEVLEVSIDD
jgi:hypothetical protein